jgi:hypothetical protein
MAQKLSLDDAKEKACVAVVNFRQADKVALADKRSASKQKAQYKELNSLRDAADKLIEAES